MYTQITHTFAYIHASYTCAHNALDTCMYPHTDMHNVYANMYTFLLYTHVHKYMHFLFFARVDYFWQPNKLDWDNHLPLTIFTPITEGPPSA